MRRQQRPLGGRILRAVLPLGRRGVVINTMLSAVADAIGGREGAVVTDSPGGGDLAGGHTLSITTIRAGVPEEVAHRQIVAAQQLGYELDERPRAKVISAPDVHWYRFVDVHWLPPLAFTVAPPGQSVDGVVVPVGSVGVRLNLFAGSTGFEHGKVLGAKLNQVTIDHLRRHGVDFAPPPFWHRYWFWWWARRAVRMRLAAAVRHSGATRGRTVGAWFLGPELVGPYTLGIATIQPGNARQITEAAENLHAGRRNVQIRFAAYAPGERIDPGFPPVPDGSSGVIVTATRARISRNANAK